MLYLVQRAFSAELPWRTTLHDTLEAARKEGAASSADYVIEDGYRQPKEYRIK